MSSFLILIHPEGIPQYAEGISRLSKKWCHSEPVLTQRRAKSRRFAAVALCTRLRAQWRGNPPVLTVNVSKTALKTSGIATPALGLVRNDRFFDTLNMPKAYLTLCQQYIAFPRGISLWLRKSFSATTLGVGHGHDRTGAWG